MRCEATARIDILLEFEAVNETRRIGIEAKLDHELTRDQVQRELSIVDKLFVLVTAHDAVPDWLATEFPNVSVLSWKDALATFPGSRLTAQDIASIKISKTRVETILRNLDLGASLPDWWVDVQRNGNGNPAILIYSPKLPDGRTLRGQLQVTGRGMPDRLEDLRFESFFGTEVHLDADDYFDPRTSDAVPAWIRSLKALHSHVLDGHEERLAIRRSAAGASRKQEAKHKLALARAHLSGSTYLAQGYADWALGPRTKPFTTEQLPELAAITSEVFSGWFDAVS